MLAVAGPGAMPCTVARTGVARTGRTIRIGTAVGGRIVSIASTCTIAITVASLLDADAGTGSITGSALGEKIFIIRLIRTTAAGTLLAGSAACTGTLGILGIIRYAHRIKRTAGTTLTGRLRVLASRQVGAGIT